MDFNFTEEQDMVRDGLSRLVREEYGSETRREVIASESGWRPEIWAQLAELGILGMPFSEEDGGFGGGAVDAMVVMEEFGKGLVVEPFVPTVVCAGGFFKLGDPGDNLVGVFLGFHDLLVVVLGPLDHVFVQTLDLFLHRFPRLIRRFLESFDLGFQCLDLFVCSFLPFLYFCW